MKVKNYIYIWISINVRPYSINCGSLLFFETTIMRNTADLAMVQKKIIDPLHKESESQRVVTEEGGGGAVQGVLYQSILNAKLTRRKVIGLVKCAQATGMTASLRILSSKADSNTWESFTRSELKLNQESPRSDIFRKSATKPLLKQKHRQKHLTWATEKKNWTVAQCCSFQMKVHLAFHL